MAVAPLADMLWARLSLATSLLLAGCGVVGGMDAKGFGGEELARKAVANGILWVVRELRSVSLRNFSFASDGLEYRGHDDALLLAVEYLRAHGEAFDGTQDLLEQLMNDNRLLALAERTQVQIVSAERLAELPGAHDGAAFVDGVFFTTKNKVDSLLADPRAFLCFVLHGLLHGYGFGRDEAQVSLAGVPTSIASQTNGEVMTRVSAVWLLFSNDYRFPIASDDTEPSGIDWRELASSDFAAARRDVRVTATTLFPVANARLRLEHRARVEVKRQVNGDFSILGFRSAGVLGCNAVVSSEKPASEPARAEVIVAFVGEDVVVRLNGAVVCQFRETSVTPRVFAAVTDIGATLERLRAHRNAAE